FTLISPGPIQESSQSAAPAGMAKLAKGLRFDLADAFSSHSKVLSDFFQRVFGSIFESETHLDDSFFTRGESIEHLFGHFLQVDVDDGVRRRNNTAIFDEIAEMRIFFLTDWSFQRDGFLSDFHDLAYFRNRNVHSLCDFFAGRFTTQLLDEGARGT